MNRPRSYTIAAVLMVFYSLFGSIDSLPRLARGASESAQAIAGQPGPPYVLVVIDFVVAVVGLVAAYGILRMQKWSVVLGIIVAAIGMLASLPAIIFAPLLFLRLMGALGVVWSAAIIVLLLRPLPRSTMAESVS